MDSPSERLRLAFNFAIKASVHVVSIEKMCNQVNIAVETYSEVLSQPAQETLRPVVAF